MLPVLKALRSALGLALLGTRRLSPVRSALPVTRLLKLRTTAAWFTCCDLGPVTVLAFFAGEAEVHLFFEAVHLGDLHFHFVAEAEHAAALWAAGGL